MEQDFGERLKKYRRERGFTQQDLADRLQVSNKTVSRWESGGGYPDVPLLVPLARSLGVSVDDLLDGERPVRTLTSADWQNLLSFAFAIGGGILFYLLKVFVPLPVCYLAFLGCLAYGVYLQRYYCYRSKWFRISCAVMDLAVNLSLFLSLAAVPAVFGWMQLIRLRVESSAALFYMGLTALILLAVILTAVTMVIVGRFALGKDVLLCYRVRVKGPGIRGVVPVICIGLLAAFFIPFQREAFAKEYYTKQGTAYLVLALAFFVVCLMLALKKGHRRGLISTGMLLVGAMLLPQFGTEYAWLVRSGRMMAASSGSSDLYGRFICSSAPQVLAASILMALALLPAILKIEEIRAEDP